jgi:hypothetical protein
MMITEQELAEVAHFGDDGRDVEVRTNVTSERIVDGEVQQIHGVEYKISPPCDVTAALQTIEEDEQTVVCDASVSDHGELCLFCPYPPDRSGELFHELAHNDRP